MDVKEQLKQILKESLNIEIDSWWDYGNYTRVKVLIDDEEVYSVTTQTK